MASFDLDFQEQEEGFKTNNALFNMNYEQYSPAKFGASTYGKGFFNADEEQYQEAKPHSPQRSPKKQEQGARKSRRRKGPIKLEPLRQQQKIQVFENTNQIGQDQPEEEVLEIKQQPKKTHSRPINLVFQGEFEEQAPQVVQPTFDESVYNARQLNETRQQLQVPQSRNVLGEFNDSDDSDNAVEPAQPVNISDPSYFNYDTLQDLKKQLIDGVKPGNLLRMELIRDKSGFNTFWPEFHLHFCRSSQYVMSAKKTSSKPSSTFVISCNKGNFQENSPYYIGKMKSNVLGDQLNIFGPGYNPSNARQKNQVPRQLVATIVYESHLFQMGKPRQFKIYVKKPEYRYYNAFPQVRMYDDEIPLNQLYENQQNRDKIVVFKNRRPKWIESLGGYMLNFKGRVQVASIKNFILEQKDDGPEIMLFGKVNDSKFNLDMLHPISPLISFALALSTFDSRIMCQ